jgi:acetyltransferase-like isoleucine patch superfamily enzyme
MNTFLRRAANKAARVRSEQATARQVARDLRVPPPSAFAAFGEGSIIVPPARVNSPEHIEVGDGVVLLEGAWLAVFAQPGRPVPRLRIGSRTRIGRSAHIACVGEVTIAEDVLTADQIFIADTYHGFEDGSRPIAQQPMAEPRPVVIERGAFLGIRSVVLQGVTVGENAYVGAGAVVTEDVPPRCVAVGNPARVVRRYDEGSGTWEPVS